ncbi:GDP-L-fucose synthase family protein [Streptomyces marincola]|uniref:GDP-L-fucose synthase family protein n=1 Tax=Streptomyces marincola TaxID=2878388 RepID=UPI001CF3CAFD|nr:GDP-L-fucose synthase [Streptomyces marincola]UCM87534.1 GDP-L-fucose synthase [Streptomyces marincola]
MTTLLEPGARVFVAGHRGLAGSAIARALADEGHEVLTRTRADLDLRDAAATEAFLRDARPDAVVLAAATVGGIMANHRFPVAFLEDNLRIQLSVIAGAHAADVDRLLFLGSSCIYPKHAPQPISEEALLTGPLEPTNEAYALAKIAGVAQVRAYRRQFGRRWITAMPTNLYGPGDTFDPETSHVLPALIRRFHDAKEAGSPEVTLWGTGTPRREFLHSADLAAACVLLLGAYDDDMPVNVGCGEDLTIAALAEAVAGAVGFTGRTAWDTAKPDGTPRKLLDVTRLNALGFVPRVPLARGIRETYEWWLHARPPARTGMSGFMSESMAQ